MKHTLKKILQESGQLPTYSAVLLDKLSHDTLINEYYNYFPSHWKLYAHHQTIDPFNLIDSNLVGTPVKLTVTHYGCSDLAFAVKVSGYNGITNNKFPHVTIAVDWNNGGRPKDSNEIVDWRIESNPVTLNGIIQNL